MKYMVIVSIVCYNIQDYWPLRAQRNRPSHVHVRPRILRKTETRDILNPSVHNHRSLKFMTDKDSVCLEFKKNIELQLLFIITTKYEHVTRRATLRRTWLSYTRNNTSSLRYVFILGKTNNATLARYVQRESRLFNDIIVGDFVDSYYNLTLKTIYGFKWAVQNCAQVKFVMKTDDDVYVNVPALLDKLRRVTGSSTMGRLWVGIKPHRNATHKWYLSYEDYANETLPDYHDGLGYALSIKLVEHILQVYPEVKYIPLEDVYVGLCLNRTGYSYRTDTFYKFIRHDLPLPVCLYKYSNVIAVHGVPDVLMEAIWKTTCIQRGPLTPSRWHQILIQQQQHT